MDLEAVGNRAAMSVHALMEETHPENDGAGIYLMLDINDDVALIMGCPTLAAEDENAKWYISSSDGDWHVEHPTFTHRAEPYDVRDWLREQANAYKAQNL